MTVLMGVVYARRQQILCYQNRRPYISPDLQVGKDIDGTAGVVLGPHHLITCISGTERAPPSTAPPLRQTLRLKRNTSNSSRVMKIGVYFSLTVHNNAISTIFAVHE